MLTESQIQRFSRQILLREVGGAGQERLLNTPVHVVGRGEAFEVARATLLAGGTPLDESAGLVIGLDVRIAGTTVAAGCRTCLEAFTEPPNPALAVLLGSLAALAMQRLIIGRHRSVSVATWNGETLVTTHPKCPHSP